MADDKNFQVSGRMPLSGGGYMKFVGNVDDLADAKAQAETQPQVVQVQAQPQVVQVQPPDPQEPWWRDPMKLLLVIGGSLLCLVIASVLGYKMFKWVSKDENHDKVIQNQSVISKQVEELMNRPTPACNVTLCNSGTPCAGPCPNQTSSEVTCTDVKGVDPFTTADGNIVIMQKCSDGTTRNKVMPLSAGPQGPQGEPGPPGIHCWDTNGDGIGDLRSEDRNRDGLVNQLDCVGRDGNHGLACWDTNGNGRGDDDEDVNKDGVFTYLDCRGPRGRRGYRGRKAKPAAPNTPNAPAQKTGSREGCPNNHYLVSLGGRRFECRAKKSDAMFIACDRGTGSYMPPNESDNWHRASCK